MSPSVSLLRVLNIPHGRAAAGVTWLLRDEFTTDKAAPIASPRTAEPGPGTWTITDPGNGISISGGNLNILGTNAWNTFIYSESIARVAGRALQIGRQSSAAGSEMGWSASAPPSSGRVATHNMNPQSTLSANYQTVGTTTLGTHYDTTIILRASGSMNFIRGGSEFPSWTLVWLDENSNAATLYATVNNFSVVSSVPYSYIRVRDLPAPFDTASGIASQDVASPVSGTSYTATADAITDLTLTAPNPLADQAGYRYRYTDDNNCWHSYFNSAGAYRLDSVAASVATNRINVAAVIAAAEARTMRTIGRGSLHNAYTLASTTWTKRGSQINVSHLDTNTVVRPYVTGSWAMSNLRSYPTTDPRYDAELNKT